MAYNSLRAKTPSKKDRLRIRILISFGIFTIFYFLIWFFQSNHIGNPFLFYFLASIVGFRFIGFAAEWFYYSSIQSPTTPTQTREWKVDMLTTFCPGEPYEMVITTLKAMVGVKYPHKTYLCDEGNDPYLKQVCDELGVIHVYRGTDKTGAKAGNINYALQHKADGAIAVVLDPDHIPTPDFLDRVLPHFEDDQVGFVQCVQGYYNQDESLVAKGAAQQTYMFYGPLMMGMHKQGTAQAIGANCSFRRSALDSIGGHATGLCEDMHTSMQMHAKGWTSVYVPEMLTKGLVPATLSGYLKQQLKWSRGCFDLLFNTWPQLFNSYGWTHRLHYLLGPIYFLNGIFTLFSILIPIIALFTASSPLSVEINALLWHGLPVILCGMAIRQYMQRFLLEEHEHGFQLVGGILKYGSWWIFTLGFIYALIGKKVPYIPTPKDDELRDEWKLSIPNIILLGLNLFALIYGLKLDWSPYTWLMGSFAVVNMFILSFAIMMAQQKTSARLWNTFEAWVNPIRIQWYLFRHRLLYPRLRKSTTSFSAVSFSLLLTLFLQLNISQTPFLLPPDNKIQSTAQHSNTIIPVLFDLSESTNSDLDSFLQAVQKNNQTPYITFEIPCEEFTIDNDIMLLVRSYQAPIWINLKMDPTLFSDRSAIDTWLTIVNQFESAAIANVSWVWKADKTITSLDRYPGKYFVDIIEWSSTSNGGTATPCELGEWMNKPVVVAGLTKNEIACQDSQRIVGYINPDSVKAPFGEASISSIRSLNKQHLAAKNNKKIIRFNAQKQAFEWIVDNEPFYVRGLAYNPQHDWRDGHCPLTRPQLEKDFELIKAMGANTIRRYGFSTYDHNILTIAGEKDLKVMYGFWFDPKIDYATDLEKIQDYKEDVLAAVNRYKNKKAVLCWVLGNETWGQLKHHFTQPYLTTVRKAYIQFLEELAQEVQAVDPERALLTSLEYSRDVAAAFYQFQQGAPTFDAIGVNAYYEEHLSNLCEISAKWDPNRPYLVTEFGPRGYWDDNYTPKDGNRLVEQSSFEKARMYVDSWSNQVELYQNDNLGGVAYCWRDRMEATVTWFGITDYKGRLKPTYYALKNTWTGSEDEFPIQDSWLINVTNPFADKDHLQFKAISANNEDLGLEYEWVIRDNEILEQEDQLNINYEASGFLLFKIQEEYRQRLTQLSHPEQKGRLIKYGIQHKDQNQRVYVFITDQNGHVVTASMPF